MANNLYMRVQHKNYTNIPYVREHDGKSHSYVDLKKFPERISDIPELVDWPELHKSVRALNSRPHYRTLGCEKSLEQLKDGAGWYLCGYVGFCLEPLSIGNSAAKYFPLFYYFSEYVSEHPFQGDVDFSFELTTSIFIEQNVGAWSGDWWVRSLAPTPEECRHNWAHAWDVLTTQMIRMETLFN